MVEEAAPFWAAARAVPRRVDQDHLAGRGPHAEEVEAFGAALGKRVRPRTTRAGRLAARRRRRAHGRFARKHEIPPADDGVQQGGFAGVGAPCIIEVKTHGQLGGRVAYR